MKLYEMIKMNRHYLTYLKNVVRGAVAIGGIALLVHGANEVRTAYQARNEMDDLVASEFNKRYGIKNILSDSVASRQIELREAFEGNTLYVVNPDQLSLLDVFVLGLEGKHAGKICYAGEDEISDLSMEGSRLREGYKKEKAKNLGRIGKFVLEKIY